MGSVKQRMLEDFINLDLIDFLKLLITREEINGVALGIAKQVINKGVSSMSERQENVIKKFVESYIEKISCDRCSNGNVTNLTDYVFIKDNSNSFCPMCESDWENYMGKD
jgi:hypothetical protein